MCSPSTRNPVDDRRPVVCVDETSKQLVSETRVPQPAAPGQLVRYDYEYRRHGVRNLFLITVPKLGWRTVQVTARRTKLACAAVLRDLVDVHFPQAEKVVLVCDNLNTHHPSVLYEAFPAGQGTAHRRAFGVALHAQARQLAQHRRNRVRGPGRPVPGPAHRKRSRAAGCNRGLGARATPWARPSTGSSRPRTPAPNSCICTLHLNEVSPLAGLVKTVWQLLLNPETRWVVILLLIGIFVEIGRRIQRRR